MANPNDAVITEFRQNGGQVGGYFAGADLLLLTTTGRHTGRSRLSPLVYTTDGDTLVIAASNGGSDRNPSWYYNVQAQPDVTVEIGERAVAARTVIPERAERDRLWAAHVAAMPSFGDYEKATDRVIPIVVIELVPDRAAV